MTSKLIILKGTSSSGKTSVAKALQSELDTTFLHFQMDMFWDMVPEHIEANSKNFPQIKYAVMDAAQSLLKRGHNVIMDIVFMPESIPALMDTFKEYNVFSVGVHCDLDVLQERERFRGDRKIGLAEFQFHEIHEGVSYDFEVDTTDKTPEQSAKIITNACRIFFTKDTKRNPQPE